MRTEMTMYVSEKKEKMKPNQNVVVCVDNNAIHYNSNDCVKFRRSEVHDRRP